MRQVITVPEKGADDHSLLSASSAHRWYACPRSLIPDGQKRGSNTAAAEGTLGHYIAEQILRGFPAPPAGSLGVCEGFEFDISESFLRDVRAYTDWVKSRPWVGQYNVEARVNYSTSLNAPYHSAWGTADCWGFEQNPSAPRGIMLRVGDLKMGRVPVSVAENPQMTSYSGGVLDSLRPILVLPGDTWVCFTIFQPRLHHFPFEWITTVQWVEAALLAMRPAAAAGVAFAAHGADAARHFPDAARFPENAGSHCQYCPRQNTCAEFRSAAMRAANAAQRQLTWDPQIFRMRKAIAEHLEALESLALDSALKGQVLPGTKLVQSARASNSQVVMPEPQLMALARQYGVLDSIYKVVPTWGTPAEIRDTFKRVNMPADQLAAIIKPGKKNPVIADADDPRPAHTPDNLSAFTATTRPLV
jgi:hypothetical protein